MALYSIDTHGELHPFLGYEWLLTNGLGAMSSSTLVGCNTRRYHGLLCAATVPPVGRVMALNRLGELIHVDGKEEFHELSINQFRNSFHPRGDRFLRRFELERAACFDFEVEGVRIRKEVQLAWMRNVVGVRYLIDPGPEREFALRLIPFVSLRDFHSLRLRGNAQMQVKCEHWELSVSEGANTLHIRADAGQFTQQADWWYGQTYAVESERGQDDTEDLFVPGNLLFKGRGPSRVTLWASMNAGDLPDWDTELARRPQPAGRVLISAPVPDAPVEEITSTPTLNRLVRAADDFVVARKRPDGGEGTTIIAGYPWFADWGRDTMISLPGLLLSTGRFEQARQVLSLFADYVSEGMIPNRFDDYSNEPHYNTVDASFWFIHACFEYLRFSRDQGAFDAQLLPACRKIIEGHIKGTRFGIRMDADGLITAGDPTTQLTWMDAKHGDTAFTPRHGKAVEINALWYHALRLLGQNDLAAKVQASFVKEFWFNAFRGLYDCIAKDYKDASQRPNQIFAVSLPHSPLSREQQHAVVEVVRRELLTPYGLRTLARHDPRYCGRYGGGPEQRDRAYHNGTVWPWLIGPFLEAYLRVNDFSADAQRQAKVWLQPLLDHMNSGCVGQIAECFPGDEPQRPVAAPAQAWSVAEVLRIAAMLKM